MCVCLCHFLHIWKYINMCVCGDRGARVNNKASGVTCEQQVDPGRESLGSLWNIFYFYNLSVSLKLFPSFR